MTASTIVSSAAIRLPNFNVEVVRNDRSRKAPSHARPFAALGALAGCGTVGSVGSSVGGFFSHQDPSVDTLNRGREPAEDGREARDQSERKEQVLPVASQDINCPAVDVAEGGAAYRVGGPDNPSVRYQFNIGDTARNAIPPGPARRR